MEEATRLAAELAAKTRLNEDEQGLYLALVAYLEVQYRLAYATLLMQAKREGFTDEELRGIAASAS